MTSELEAINQILSVIGESPVNTITDSQLPADVTIAINILEEVNRAIQSEGWHFNTENKTLSPDGNNEILVPTNVLSIDSAKDEYQDIDPVEIDGKLYNYKKNSYTFTSKVKLEIIYKRTWDQLPEAFKDYIARVSGRKLQMRVMGDRILNQELLRDEIIAKAKFIDYDSQNADRTIFDDVSVAGVLNR